MLHIRLLSKRLPPAPLLLPLLLPLRQLPLLLRLPLRLRPRSLPLPPIAGGEKVNSPMPGNILDVKVKAGDAVKAGQPLFILEAMKMENEIPAPRDGKVAQVLVNKGAVVNTGEALCVLE